MASLPVVSGRECVKALRRLGYEVARQRGSHVRMRCPGRTPVTVPMHDELDRGTPRSILRTVDVTPDEFRELLR